MTTIFKFNIKDHIPEAADIRCECGRLLARRVEHDVIEIKCRRCERTIAIRVDQLPPDGSFVEPPDSESG